MHSFLFGYPKFDVEDEGKDNYHQSQEFSQCTEVGSLYDGFCFIKTFGSLGIGLDSTVDGFIDGIILAFVFRPMLLIYFQKGGSVPPLIVFEQFFNGCSSTSDVGRIGLTGRYMS
ncbi:hypothetical protein RB195_025575 [Necator americanus]|uniref:Uncharacterized protein n=1 Tax=Necator americanus TaxID=51031 RepID=A0ABR1EV17_NECAM